MITLLPPLLYLVSRENRILLGNMLTNKNKQFSFTSMDRLVLNILNNANVSACIVYV